jgi:DNA-binding MarR family transcriptional regulator
MTTEKEAVRLQTLVLMLLIDASNVAQRALEKRLNPLDLSVPQQRILTYVYFAEESLTPGLLAGLLLQEPHSISGLLNRLEDRGLVARTRDRRDRRVVWVGLTPEGRQVAEDAIEIERRLCKEFAPILTEPKGEEAMTVISNVRDVSIRLAGVREKLRAEALRRA